LRFFNSFHRPFLTSGGSWNAVVHSLSQVVLQQRTTNILHRISCNYKQLNKQFKF
jgi:hypothetical protein